MAIPQAMPACGSWSQIIAAEMQRPGDLAARYGGEEFAMLLPNTDAAGCARIGDRIPQRDPRCRPRSRQHHAVGPASPFRFGGAACRPSLERTAGVVSLVEAADRALYAAKDAGRDRLMMSGEVMNLLPKASGQ